MVEQFLEIFGLICAISTLLVMLCRFLSKEPAKEAVVAPPTGDLSDYTSDEIRGLVAGFLSSRMEENVAILDPDTPLHKVAIPVEVVDGVELIEDAFSIQIPHATFGKVETIGELLQSITAYVFNETHSGTSA